jgi:hypothetical protein
MKLILLFNNEQIDVSQFERRLSDFEKTWVKELLTARREGRKLTRYFPNISEKAETIGVYYQADTPQYIHRKLVELDAEYLIEVEDWMRVVYHEQLEIKEKHDIKQMEWDIIQAEKIKYKALRKQIIEIRTAKINAICKRWLNGSTRNIKSWNEAFEPHIEEENHLLALMDKKMLS